MDELFLFVRPPRPLWPFNGPGSAFWPPLAFASLAAALREKVRDLRVAILDAPALKMGWKSLTAEMRRLQPSYIGIGEEAVSCQEGLRVAALGKEAGARVIAGGCFFGNVGPQALQTGLIDVIVQGEGEETIVELISALRSRQAGDFRRVRGIHFLDGEEVVFTGHRPPIPNLDDLPFPAYDLLPSERYGQGSRNHAGLAAVESSRGCTAVCEFCVLWRQMGRFRGGRWAPAIRTKSPQRLREEIRVLTRHYGRRYLGWVDPCFNAHPRVPRQLAELLLRENLRIGQSAWVRADYLLRDENSGALGTSIDSGLNELYFGVERAEKEDLRLIKKGYLNGEVASALRLLEERYPSVFTLGSFIYGLPSDTPRSVWRLARRAYRLPLDMTFFIPLTPLPGTPYWKPEMWDPTGQAYRDFDFLPHANGDARQARLAMTLFWSAALLWPRQRLGRTLSGLWGRHARRRSITRRHLSRAIPFVTRGIFQGLLNAGGHSGMRIPEWYDR
jgi:anaerobic magnesium-protoporphyrin IX monomethyl ester cyclase